MPSPSSNPLLPLDSASIDEQIRATTSRARRETLTAKNRRRSAKAPRSRRRSWNHFYLLLAICSLITVVNLLHVVPLFGGSTLGRASTIDAKTATATLHFYAAEIERFRTRNGQLPATLAEAGRSAARGLRYELVGGSHFRLELAGKRLAYVYDSRTPATTANQ